MLQKNDIYETEILSYASGGEGVCRVDGIPVFVPFSAKGDKLLVRILKAHKTYAFGKIEKILIPSDKRTAPQCPVFGKCGGCDIMHLSYDEQLSFKYTKVEDAIRRIGKSDAEIMPVTGADKLTCYRNKTQMPVAFGNAVYGGFYAKNSHRVTACENCLIQKEFSRKISRLILDFANKYKISVYDEESGRGCLRHIYIREGKYESMVMLIINGKTLPHVQKLADSLKSCGVTTFGINTNSKKTNVIMGDSSEIIFGTGKIIDEMCGIKFEISPESFYQVNTAQAEKLYETAVKFADISKNDTVFDLYCGAGTISLYAAKFAKKVIGIEIVPEAVENARRNAVLNGIENAEFYCGDAAKITEKLIKNGISADTVIIDPPRKGCDESLLRLLLQINPPKISYVSCNPSTLARDINFLEQNGYKCKTVCPVDMFVGSSHVECAALLTKNQLH